jgi:hypothetical protein
VIDPAALRMVLMVLTGWLDRRETQAIAYLIEENRLLRRQLNVPADVDARSPRLYRGLEELSDPFHDGTFTVTTWAASVSRGRRSI